MDLDEHMATTPTTEIAPLQLPYAAPALGERYRLGRLLGSGGMADVFLADDLCLGRSVAVKVLHPVHAADASGLERFRREAIALASIASPNVARIHDAKLEMANAYLVMEHVNGATVDDEVSRRGKLEPAHAEAVLLQILDALTAIHSIGLIHRDVKPTNVLVETSGRVVLIDLGIAFDSRRYPLTAPGMAAGTPGYLAPELEPAPASDIYQVGLLTLFMLTGVDPARGARTPDLEAALAELPGDLALVVRRALAVDPKERFASAQSMRAAVIASRSPMTSDSTGASSRDPGTVRQQRATTQIAPRQLRALLAAAAPSSQAPHAGRSTTTVRPPGYLSGPRHTRAGRRRPRVRMSRIELNASPHGVVDVALASVVSRRRAAARAWFVAVSLLALAIVLVAMQ